MEVQVQTSRIIACSSPESFELPFTIFDRLATKYHTPMLLAFSAPTATNEDIIQGLEKTIASFPTLAGQIVEKNNHHPESILVGGDSGGVLLVEATVASKLEDHLPLEPSRDLWGLHPPVVGAVRTLQVQLNRFQCGGLLIGMTTDHHAADGCSIGSFVVAWGQMTRGITSHPSPTYDRSWLKPRSPPRCEFQHRGYEFLPPSPDLVGVDFPKDPTDVEIDRISNMKLHYSSEFIATKLKSRMPEKYSTFATLLGHLWRKITMARGLDGDQQTFINVSVNCRPRLRPPVPKEFFGNLVLPACPRAKAGQLIQGGVTEAVRMVREAVRAIGDDYIRSFMDFGALHGEDEEDLVPNHEAFGNSMFPSLEADSWLGFGFEEVDFGGGGALRAFCPTWYPVEGLVFFLPTMHGDGGVDVLVTLLEEHAMVLKDTYLSLD